MEQMSLVNSLTLGQIESHNENLYQEQLKTFWEETKTDFNKLFDFPNSLPPSSDEFWDKTEEWEQRLKATYDIFSSDDSCQVYYLSENNLGKVAGSIISLRKLYNYYFELIYFEDEVRIQEDLKEVQLHLSNLEFAVENSLKGVTRTREFENTEMSASTTYEELLDELEDAYLDQNTRGYPWNIAWSGGKDSSLVVKAVVEMLERLPKYKRIREVHVTGVDTQLEIPQLLEHVRDNAWEIQEYAKVKELPITVNLLEPEIKDRFFALVIGLGYPPPNRLLRFCTERIKIKPGQKYQLDLSYKYGNCITLLGTREDESAARKKSIQKNSIGTYRYSFRNTKKRVESKLTELDFMIYQPIRYLKTDEVWNSLEKNGLPWGLGYSRMKKLYKDAEGECPLIIDKEAVNKSKKACGSRFGCVVCTLVAEDKSLKNFIQSGNEWLKPVYNFRNFMLELANNPEMREKASFNRQTGKIINDKFQGGFNKKGRMTLFNELMRVREEIKRTKPEHIDYDIITDEEIAQIKKYWGKIDNVTAWKKDDKQITLEGLLA